jgi:hypothetical protein
MVRPLRVGNGRTRAVPPPCREEGEARAVGGMKALEVPDQQRPVGETADFQAPGRQENEGTSPPASRVRGGPGPARLPAPSDPGVPGTRWPCPSSSPPGQVTATSVRGLPLHRLPDYDHGFRQDAPRGSRNVRRAWIVPGPPGPRHRHVGEVPGATVVAATGIEPARFPLQSPHGAVVSPPFPGPGRAKHTRRRTRIARSPSSGTASGRPVPEAWPIDGRREGGNTGPVVHRKEGGCPGDGGRDRGPAALGHRDGVQRPPEAPGHREHPLRTEVGGASVGGPVGGHLRVRLEVFNPTTSPHCWTG